ncbi:MAG: DUF4167 domain-containing protein [Alphaproteobacteria bacterium]
MRPGPHKRSRGRSHHPNHPGHSGGHPGPNGRKHLPLRLQTFDSNGPSVKIRGNAYQVFEKYIALAREATTSGDRIAAENFYQHAEHYFRIINADGGPQPQSMQRSAGEFEGGGEGEGASQDGNGANGAGEQSQAVSEPGAEQPQPN